MDSKAFAALQAPLRERYRQDARSALLTLKTRGALDALKIACNVQTGRGLATAGLHPMTGGTGADLCSGDMLLEALVACAGVSLKAAATALDVPIRSAQILAEGDVDLRGTLGIADGVPVGFKEIRLRFEVDSTASKQQIDELLRLTERYCVIRHTLQSSPKLDFRIEQLRG